MDIKRIKQQLIKAYSIDAKRRKDKNYAREEWKLSLREKFVKILKLEKKKTILELGAGAGIDSEYFTEQGFDVLAIDLSPKMIEACIARGLNAEVLDIYEIDSLEQKFDAIFSLNVLLHVPQSDLPVILQRISNQLNPSGIFHYGVFGGPNREEFYTDEDKTKSPRFFSFMSDKKIRSVVKEYFDIIKFEKIDINANSPELHFQSLLLRKND